MNEKEGKRKEEHLGTLLNKKALENIEKAISEDQQKTFEAKTQQENLEQSQRKQKEQAKQHERNRKAWIEQKEKERKEQEEQRAREIEQKRKEQEHLSFRKMTEGNI